MRLRLLTATLALAVAAGATDAFAQVAQVPFAELSGSQTYQSGKLAQPTITLADAVELALRHSPDLGKSRQALAAAAGSRRQAKGAFDYTFDARPALTVTKQELTPFLQQREVAKRTTIATIAEDFTELTEAIQSIIAGTSTTPPHCPSGVTFAGDDTVLEGLDPKETALLGVNHDIRSVVTIDLEQNIAGFNLTNICSAPVPTLVPSELFASVWHTIDESGGLGLNGVLTSTSQISSESRQLEEQITQAVAARATLALDELGPVPTDDLLRNVTFDFSVSKLLRKGLSFTGDFQMQSQEHNFVDKPLDPSYGGLEVPAEFYAAGSLTLNVPLGQGLGATATDASERVAEHLLDGQRDQLRFDATTTVFQTVLAYLNLVAARDTLALVDASNARMQQILDISQRLINASELPAIEINRVRARAASVASSDSQARAALNAARVTLARTIGVDAASIDVAPLPAGTFLATLPPVPDTVPAIADALASRRDEKALNERRLAAEALFAGARAEARREVNYYITVGYSNLYDSPFFKYLPDGSGNIIDTTPLPLPIATLAGASNPPGQSPVRFFDPAGFYRALTGRYTPMVETGFSINLPFGNHAARGRSAQAEANLSTATTESVDLERTVTQNIVGLTAGLRQLAAQIDQGNAAVAADNQLVTSELQRLQSRDVTLIDAILTEEDTTGDQLALVQARQAYFSTLARLEFETGHLVTFEQPDSAAELLRFLSTTFITQ